MAKQNSVASEATKTLDALFFDRVKRMSASVAFKEYDKKRREWRSVSWAGLGLEMTRWRGALEREGLKPGARVAVMLDSCKEWVIFEQAAMVLDLIVVPIFPNDSLDNIAFILRDSGSQVLLINDLQAWQRMEKVQGFIGFVNRVILLNVREEQEAEVKELGDPRVVVAKDWLPIEGGPLQERHSDTNRVCTIVYTPGTTGQPKGVMLTHLNLLANARAVLNMMTIRNSDTFLSHLNLAHILDRTISYYVPMMAGCVVAFARTLENFDNDLVDLNPSIMVTETHFLSRLMRKLDQEMEDHVFIDRMLFKLAVNAGWANFEVEQKRKAFSPLAYLWPMLKGMSAYAIMPKVVGERLRRVIVSGDPLSPTMAKLFLGLGINLLQGYHHTEASGLVSLNGLLENVPESIGKSLPIYKVKIGMDGELNLASDVCISPGYMGKAEEAESPFQGEWLHTRDLAEYHDEHLYYHGRIEEQIELEGKTRLNPEAIESAIISNSLFDYALVTSDGRALCAVVVLNRALYLKHTNSMGLDSKNANNYNHPKVRGLILQHIRSQTYTLPQRPDIQAFVVSDIPWTVENGMLTPTLRPRRHAVRKQFGVHIAQAYLAANSEAASRASLGKLVGDHEDDVPTL